MKQGTYSPEEIEKRFNALPPDIKSFVYGADMLSFIQQLGTKYKLHIDQLGLLEGETADVMTGFSKPEDFQKNIASSLAIDPAQAELITKDINEGLFLKIRESMKKVHAPQANTGAPETSIAEQKISVSMPSAVAAPKPVAPAPPPPPAIAPKPVAPPNFVPADMMLSQKTVTKMPAAPLTPPQQVPPPAPKPPAPSVVSPAPVAPTPAPAPATTKPPEYKADPYREPPL